MSQKPKIAMLVANQCAPDTRVIKQAETLVDAGYDVRVICFGGASLPLIEVVNGVTYERIQPSVWRYILYRLGCYR
jgi:hypothetical protein